MKLHANAPFGPKGRLTMVKRVTEQRWSLKEAAEAAGVSERTCCKWVGRYRTEGRDGLEDRSSAPRSVPLTRTDFGNALHLRIPASEGGLREDGFAMPEQLRAISHERLSRRVSVLRPKSLEELLKRCRVLLR